MIRQRSSPDVAWAFCVVLCVRKDHDRIWKISETVSAALKDKTRTLSLLKDALKNDLPKFRVLQAAYELGILEAIQRSNPISTDDRLKITTGLVSQYAMLENAAKNAIDYWQDSVDVDILYRALNDADECRESRINSAESTARPAIPIKPQQNPAENLLKIESISQDSIRMGIRLQWKKQSEIECYEIWRAKESEQPVKIKEGSFLFHGIRITMWKLTAAILMQSED